MKVLVTGADGFVGHYLVKELHSNGHQVVAMIHGNLPEGAANSFPKGISLFSCDLTDRAHVFKAMQEWQPEAVAHLAGIAHIVNAGRDVSRLIEVNTIAVKHLCDGIDAYATQPVPLLFASSALVYGTPQENAVLAADENSLLLPVTAYAKSKAAAEFILKSYDGTHIRPRIARPFNHTGPGQSTDFVCPGFVKKVIQSQDGTIPVGNLSALRDICDVRDIVRAYRLMLEYQGTQDCFVLGSGQLVKISDILMKIIKISGKLIEPIVDAKLLRPADDGAIYANTALAKKLLGWEPRFSLDTTLLDLYHAQLKQ